MEWTQDTEGNRPRFLHKHNAFFFRVSSSQRDPGLLIFSWKSCLLWKERMKKILLSLANKRNGWHTEHSQESISTLSWPPPLLLDLKSMMFSCYLVHEVLEVGSIRVYVVMKGVVGKGFPWRMVTLNFERLLDWAVVSDRTAGHERYSSHVYNVLHVSPILWFKCCFSCRIRMRIKRREEKKRKESINNWGSKSHRLDHLRSKTLKSTAPERHSLNSIRQDILWLYYYTRDKSIQDPSLSGIVFIIFVPESLLSSLRL